ncbi:endomembrane protein 70, putative [Bodo saltans]|uniref:Transmembrane 9 superfamily member n=1 Tax=Bodo saltans TaxID=75058 RepID=A0A0S4JIF4_BODSA|nr:endomembrane protein 70, putative [Bodo saltans]|eukprot:CUG91294.1 endomembrane protein 70, putative [Bodo saltans]
MCASRRTLTLSAVAMLLLASVVDSAFYIPFVTPAGYSMGETLAFRVNSLTSHQGVLPYPFYSVKTCQPSKERIKKERKHENLGEVLWGDQIEPSEYFVGVLKNVTCRKVCNPLGLNTKEMETLTKRIEQQYRGNMVLDSLPVAQLTNAGPRHPKVLLGYPLGVPAKLSPHKKTLINNHLHFTIMFNEPDIHDDANEETYRIVGFYVSAHSVNYQGREDACLESKPFAPEDFEHLSTDATEVSYTYSVSWLEEPDVAWATRWDIYLRGGENDKRIHWMSIINSLLIVVFLSFMVAMIMMRTLHKDFNRYNDPENEDEAQEETGWKLVHGDVFRSPSAPVLLSSLVGSGVQFLSMAAITLIIACFGFLSPSYRGGLLTAVIFSFVMVGSLAGYVSSKFLKLFKHQSWRNAFATGLIVPGFLMTVYLLLNFVHWGKHASSAVPFTTLLMLFTLWFCCSLPLVIVGAAIGFKQEAITVPCKINLIPRIIPEGKWYLERWTVILASGTLPFGAAFIELVYILSSFWQGRVYYMFGFLAVVFFILFITCAEVAIVMIYLQLCYEDYNWWWRSFLLAASSGLHLFLYSIYYLIKVLTIRQPTSLILYVGYMFSVSTIFAIVTGTVGFLSAWFFIRKIYGSIKID